MNLLKEIGVLIRKDLMLELRNSYAISGILLYVFSSVFVVYVAFQEVSPPVWSALFWIIMLFASTNAVSKSFVQESGRLQLYYYILAHPTAVILSKVTYNVLLLLLLSFLVYVALSFITIDPIQDYLSFAVALVLGSIGFSIAFTFISAISAKTSNSSTLIVILSFPVVIPIVITLVKLTIGSVGMLSGSTSGDILILLGIDLLLLAVALVLFPFLWRD